MLLSALCQGPCSTTCAPGSSSLHGPPHVCAFLGESLPPCRCDADPRFLMTCSMRREWDIWVLCTQVGAGCLQGQGEYAPGMSLCQQHQKDAGGLTLLETQGLL